MSVEGFDFKAVEEKWQGRWNDAKAFEPRVDKERQKYLFTTPYPYISGSLHLGHGRAVTEGDVFCRFQRMRGKNVLFPMAFHISGTPVLAISTKVAAGEKDTVDLYKEYVRAYEKDEANVAETVESFKDPWNIVKFFIPKMRDEYSSLGLSVDWTRSFTSGDFLHQKLVEWQFNKYKELGLLKQGSHFLPYCVRDKNAVGEDDIKDGDTNPVDRTDYVLLKFPVIGRENVFLVAATLRPETVFGQTNLWVNSKAEYSKITVEGETWIASKEFTEKISHQVDGVKELSEKVKGSELVGWKVKASVSNAELPVLPCTFCDPRVGTGVVVSVPSDSPDDWIALKDLQENKEFRESVKVSLALVKDLTPVSIIQAEGFGDYPAGEACARLGVKSQDDREKLEEAKKEVYKAGFYAGKMKASCGKYAGKSVGDTKEEIRKDLEKAGKALAFYDTSREAVCRCGGKVVISEIKNQWFIDFNSKGWKDKARKALSRMTIAPEQNRKLFEDTFAWLDKRPCARQRGLGTPLPFDKKWMIESLSDSTLYTALYPISSKVKEFKLSPEQLNREFFDFVMAGEGDAKKASAKTGVPEKQLKELREAFDYWYPVDKRHTFVPHLSNHLSFWILAHAAVLGEKYWPKDISFHGLVTREGSKMSKSKGNVITLLSMKNEHGSDFFRAYLCSVANSESDFDWRDEDVHGMKGTLKALREAIQGAITNRSSAQPTRKSSWFVSRFEKAVQESTGHLEKMQLKPYASTAVNKLLNDYKEFTAHSGDEKEVKAVNNYVVGKWVLLLAPLIPATSEEFWELLGKNKSGKDFASLAAWPEADESRFDEEAEQARELGRKAFSDSRTVLELVSRQGKTPKALELFVAEPWKYDAFKEVQAVLKETRNPGELVKKLLSNAKLKQHAREVAALAPRIAKNPEIVPSLVLSQGEEENALKEAKAFIERELGVHVKVSKAQDSANERAKNALPGKPAISVEN